MKITLYEKKRGASESEFLPVHNERLVWLLNFISNVEEDKSGAKYRLESLLHGEMINTDLSSFIIKVTE